MRLRSQGVAAIASGGAQPIAIFCKCCESQITVELPQKIFGVA